MAGAARARVPSLPSFAHIFSTLPTLLFFILQVAAAVSPDLVIFVMDGSIGQAAFDQAAAFRAAVDVGAVILTKMDGHARGGGALAAVAATSAPIAFIGTGEHLDELERFEPRAFVGRLLGRGDWKGFVDRIADAVPPGGEGAMEAVLAQIQAGKFTLRLMYDQFVALQRMGPLGQVMGMIPGLAGMMGGADGGAGGADKASALKMRRSMTIMDSMTDEVRFMHVTHFLPPFWRPLCLPSLGVWVCGRKPPNLSRVWVGWAALFLSHTHLLFALSSLSLIAGARRPHPKADDRALPHHAHRPRVRAVPG